MKKPWCGLSLMTGDDFFRASNPLFEAGLIDVVEWSFDTGWDRVLPPFLLKLIKSYEASDRLLGHGVSFSLLSAAIEQEQDKWLDKFELEISKLKYKLISEHFGFMSAGDFLRTAPLPMPFTSETFAIAKENLLRLVQAAGGVPVGIENLAFAFSQDDVRNQGTFIDDLLKEIDGFLLLDLHNIYCQSLNFNWDPLELLETYPLKRVREVHISGGSWSFSSSKKKKIRRDTHDDSVPDAVFSLLESIIPRCQNLEAVILEQVDPGLVSEEQQEGFRNDFIRLRQIVEHAYGSKTKS